MAYLERRTTGCRNDPLPRKIPHWIRHKQKKKKKERDLELYLRWQLIADHNEWPKPCTIIRSPSLRTRRCDITGNRNYRGVMNLFRFHFAKCNWKLRQMLQFWDKKARRSSFARQRWFSRENQIRPNAPFFGWQNFSPPPFIPTIVRPEVASAASGANLVKRTNANGGPRGGDIFGLVGYRVHPRGGLSFRSPVSQPPLIARFSGRNSVDKRSLAVATLEGDTPWPTTSIRDKFLKSHFGLWTGSRSVPWTFQQAPPRW